jgi:hypothetical protein
MASEPQQARRQHSFILCLWQEGSAMPNAPPIWRCSLEEPYVAGRRGFRHLDELYAFLAEWMRTAAAPTGNE